MQEASVALRILSPRPRLSGPGDGDALENLITTTLPDGALCWVEIAQAYYRLDKNGTVTAGGTVIAGAGGGTWTRVGDVAGSWLPPVYAAATGAVDEASPASATFDGITVPTGEQVLLAFQQFGVSGNGITNGVYTFNGVGVPMTRVPWFDDGSEVRVGAIAAVRNGVIYSGQLFEVRQILNGVAPNGFWEAGTSTAVIEPLTGADRALSGSLPAGAATPVPIMTLPVWSPYPGLHTIRVQIDLLINGVYGSVSAIVQARSNGAGVLTIQSTDYVVPTSAAWQSRLTFTAGTANILVNLTRDVTHASGYVVKGYVESTGPTP